MEHLKHNVSMTEVLRVNERWRESYLAWYNPGQLSIALPDSGGAYS